MTNPSSTKAAPLFEAQTLGASLTVSSLADSVAWYRDVIGFAVTREYAPRGTLFAVALSAGTVELLLTQDDGALGAERVKGVGFSLQFTTKQDIDSLAAGIVARGGVLEDQPFDARGARAFRLRDPDGFKLVFSSPR
jgi:catechol 2,3-dioxygenase-like lactoylglutathione lyase family enzyme